MADFSRIISATVPQFRIHKAKPGRKTGRIVVRRRKPVKKADEEKLLKEPKY